ncbi:MAG: ATP-binding protein [Pseudomonadota bacterium]
MDGTQGPSSQADARLEADIAAGATAAAHAIGLTDDRGRLVWINPGFTRLTGYEAADAIGRTPCELILSADDQAEHRAAIISRLERREGFRIEISARNRAGEPLWADADFQPVGEPGGGFVLTLVDIRQVREAQRRGEAASSALRDAARLAGLGGWEIDFRERLVRYSPELQALMGYSAPVHGFEDALEVYLPEHREAALAQILSTGLHGVRMDFEAEALTGDGRRIWLRVMGTAEFVEGQCVAIRGASQDITEQRRVVAELRESEGFARGVIDGIAAMVAVVDAEGRLVEANRAFRLTGASLRGGEDYPMGGNLFHVFAQLPGGHGRALERGVRMVLDGKREIFTRAYQAKDGEWFRLSASRFVGQGPVRAVLFTQSIADLKRSERRLRNLNASLKRARDEADAANIAKSAFLATMSHEIRTPLNGVLGMAQAMARDALPPQQQERLAVVRQAGETLLTLLNDLLDLSRIEAGRLEIEDGTVDIAQIAEAAHSTFTTLAAEKDVSLSLEVAPEAAGPWRGDPTRVRQILYNLVANAVKFTSRGSVDVRVSRAGGDLVMAVADTGPGIAPDRLPSLFDKFVQADASTTRKFGGSGLGLAICKELCQLMGGDIAVKSELGLGSTFTVRLPLPPAPVGAGEPLPPPAPAAAPAGAVPVRLLAAEDNPMNQLVLKTLLAPLAIDLHIVGDGESAVAAWQDGDWDAILMDVQMPRMDGPTAARTIRAYEEAEGRRRTPIIALTANAMSHHEQEYLEAGMDALTPKPIQLERLLDALDEVLAQQPQET